MDQKFISKKVIIKLVNSRMFLTSVLQMFLLFYGENAFVAAGEFLAGTLAQWLAVWLHSRKVLGLICSQDLVSCFHVLPFVYSPKMGG